MTDLLRDSHIDPFFSVHGRHVSCVPTAGAPAFVGDGDPELIAAFVDARYQEIAAEQGWQR